MGLFSFFKDLGKKIFKSKEEEPETTPEQLLEKQKQAVRDYIAGVGLNISNFNFDLDADGKITLYGEAPSKADYEKAALTAGNIQGVSSVDNQIVMAAGADEPDATLYQVEKGDSLWKIAEKHYGNGAKYTEIFEANQPMIKDADEIYPGQILRIPAQA